MSCTLTRTNKQTKKGVHLLCKIISLHLFDTSIMQKLFISLTAASLQLRKELHEIHQTEVELHFLYHQSTSELSCMDLKSYHESPFLRTEKSQGHYQTSHSNSNSRKDEKVNDSIVQYLKLHNFTD